jgi:hypothetical protein
MAPKEIPVLEIENEEVLAFVEQARLHGPLHVKIGSVVYSVKVSLETVSPSARDFLTKGGRKAD